jgi:hypothetical protein
MSIVLCTVIKAMHPLQGDQCNNAAPADFGSKNTTKQSKQNMPVSTPMQGLPSPPPRTPVTPSRSFPYVFAPHLPKLGTAKVRLRSNVFGLSAYIIIWWQAGLYGYAKDAVVLVLSNIWSSDSVKWAIGSIGMSIWHRHFMGGCAYGRLRL